MEALSVSHAVVDGQSVVSVRGEIDLDSAPDLRSKLLHVLGNGNGGLVLDLHEVTFADSTALGVLVGTERRAHALGGRVRIAAATVRFRQLLEMTGLDVIFPSYDTVEDALAAVVVARPDGAAAQDGG